MVSIKKENEIIDLAEKLTTNWFISMLNPKYRGPKFNFEKYDIEEFVEVNALSSFVQPLNKSENELLKKHSRLTWNKLLNNSDVINWIYKQ